MAALGKRRKPFLEKKSFNGCGEHNVKKAGTMFFICNTTHNRPCHSHYDIYYPSKHLTAHPGKKNNEKIGIVDQR